MQIRRLSISNFRGYEKLDLEFAKGINVLTGNNGAGKTNLVEAIAFLSRARSFRTNDESELRKKGTSFSKIQGTIFVGSRKKEIEMLLFSKGKKITVNKHEISKISELLTESHVVVFKPQDVFLFDDTPSLRRRFMDSEISHYSLKYLQVLKKYEKVLQERNRLLKDENVDLLHLEALTDQLIDAACEIVQKRKEFFDKLQPCVQKITSLLTRDEKEYRFVYEPFIDADQAYHKEQVKTAFKKALESDLRYHATTIGPHREDFSSALNGLNLSENGSQGEKRLGALILKLALYEMEEEAEKKPIVILDDVLSELDERHQSMLLEMLGKFEQVFITTTEWKNEIEATIYDVADHKVIRRNIYGG